MLRLMLAALLGAVPNTMHDFHVSITQIELNAASQRLEVAVKIFTDDLEAAVQPADLPPLRLATGQEHAGSNEMVAAYVRKHVTVRNDGALIVLTYLGKETEADATWCYLESQPIEQVGRLEVTNSLLLSQFDDQVNIIHFTRDGKTRAKLTGAGEVSAVFE